MQLHVDPWQLVKSQVAPALQVTSQVAPTQSIRHVDAELHVIGFIVPFVASYWHVLPASQIPVHVPPLQSTVHEVPTPEHVTSHVEAPPQS